VFENRVLRRIFGELQNEELSDFYSSLSIIRIMKSRGMRLAAHVARMGEMNIYIWCSWERQKERDHYEDKA
jgi:hypothetical protein